MVLSVLDRLGMSENSISLSAKSFAVAAQKKVNALKRKLDEDTEKLRFTLLERGTAESCLFSQGRNKLLAVYEERVDEILAELAFQIGLSTPPSGGDTGGGSSGSGTEHSYPRDPDYSLDFSERYYAVFNYYMAMENANVRFALFQADELAKVYLGEFYATLYDRLRLYTTGA